MLQFRLDKAFKPLIDGSMPGTIINDMEQRLLERGGRHGTGVYVCSYSAFRRFGKIRKRGGEEFRIVPYSISIFVELKVLFN